MFLQANTRYNTVVGMHTNMVSGMPVVESCTPEEPLATLVVVVLVVVVLVALLVSGGGLSEARCAVSQPARTEQAVRRLR
eukprot:COSAG06_NODE_6813_length_2765_cov_2.024381_2_plen_80_part_00